ncbi:hypothetical protein [Shewanella xiamenensis]|uniref:hypothetical protein n=1 Tax=Shewanella xiamenensis TaxID=332186 RepID=UPI001F051C60|nr:hypothetical protein [Shewanella xiamenensis]UML95630.1 hypothetical protein MKD32_10210 [Shewanella xiamenensis]
MMEKDKNLRIKPDELRRLQMAAIEIGYKTKEPCKWQDIVRYMMENYTEDAVKDISASKSPKK